MSDEPIEERDDEIQEFSRGRYRGETFIFEQSTPKARKRHVCHACCEPIEVGTHYVTYVTVDVEGPGFETWRLHGECFLAGGSMFGGDPRPSWRWVCRDRRPRRKKRRRLNLLVEMALAGLL
jgi:hypothetical protein